MGLFFTTRAAPHKPDALLPEFTATLTKALVIDPQSLANPHETAGRMVRDIITNLDAPAGGAAESKKFRWSRFFLSLLLLAILFGAGIYCAHDDKLAAFSQALVHGFEVLLGGLIGMVIGEGASS